MFMYTARTKDEMIFDFSFYCDMSLFNPMTGEYIDYNCLYDEGKYEYDVAIWSIDYLKGKYNESFDVDTVIKFWDEYAYKMLTKYGDNLSLNKNNLDLYNTLRTFVSMLKSNNGYENTHLF